MADQIVKPYEDVSNSGWSITPPNPDPDPGHVWPAVDDETYSDASYVNAVTVGAVYEVKISKDCLCLPGDGEHLLIVRHRKHSAPSDAGSLKVTLLKGRNQVAARTITVSSTSFTTFSSALTADEVKGLGDYTDLRLRVETVPVFVTPCCPDNPIPETLTAQLSTKQNPIFPLAWCTCMTGKVTLTHSICVIGGLDTHCWQGTGATGCGHDMSLRLYCSVVLNKWILDITWPDGCGANGTITDPTSGSCDPFILQYLGVDGINACGCGNYKGVPKMYNITITP